MKISTYIPFIFIGFFIPDMALAKTFDLGSVTVDARANIDLQAALVSTSEMSLAVQENMDWAARLKINHKIEKDIDVGFVIKLDQDFDVDSAFSMRRDGINRRLTFGYAKSKWGVMSIGNMAGQADRLSLYAPRIGTGQIRGDFSRYMGRSALLTAYDTQNAFKLDYVTPSDKPIVLGISYAPQTQNNATGQIRQRDAFEFAAQGKIALDNDWTLKSSAAYVTSDSALDNRQDIQSWALGFEFQKTKEWTVSGAYVSRGDSDSSAGLNEREFNAGMRYRKKKWGVSVSAARLSSTKERRNTLGAGAEIKVNKHMRLRIDAVGFRAVKSDRTRQDGIVLLSDIRLSY